MVGRGWEDPERPVLEGRAVPAPAAGDDAGLEDPAKTKEPAAEIGETTMRTVTKSTPRIP
jgi:hypothetical protein